MNRLNGRISKIEQATTPTIPPMWYHDRDPLVLFCIHLKNRGIELTNAEFTELTGLPVPVPLNNQEIEAHLIELALTHEWPEALITPFDYLINYFTWKAIEKYETIRQN
jgi:hypothetical protein